MTFWIFNLITAVCFLNQWKITFCQLDFDAGDVLSNCMEETRFPDCRTVCIFRKLDGSCNNLAKFAAGAARTRLLRITAPHYADGLHAPHGFPYSERPSANQISQAVFQVSEENSQSTRNGMSLMFMVFGQFIDHDMSLTPIAACSVEDCQDTNTAYSYPCFPIKFESDDSECTSFGRSTPVCQDPSKPRAFINMISSYIDASQLYSNEEHVHEQLRTFEDGLMLLDDSNLLPLLPDDECELENGCSLAGEERVDENIGLNAFHTVWVREHNRIASELKIINPHWDDVMLFETTRKIIGGILQHITYEHYLPHLVDMPEYSQYNCDINPAITIPFSTAAYRFGHSLVPNAWPILDENFDKAEDNLPLRDTLRNIKYIRDNGIESLIYGLIGNQSQTFDTIFSHSVARTLFIPSTMSGYRDLTALNIQRGRDHGLPTYGAWRSVCGLSPLHSWSDLDGIMPNDAISNLQSVYDHPNDIDLFAAGVAEMHLPNREVGPTFSCIIKDQFIRLRLGDRYFYRKPNVFTESQLDEIQKVTLSKVLCNNLQGVVSLQEDVFIAFNTELQTRRECSSFPDLDLEQWRD